MFRKRRTTGEPKLVNGLTRDELDELGSYNFRRTHGIVHTETYQRRMAELQAIFDRNESAWLKEQNRASS